MEQKPKVFITRKLPTKIETRMMELFDTTLNESDELLSEDELIRDKDFTLASTETIIPSDENDRVFRQYRYLIGGQGGDLSEFVRFQLKIVFRSTNQAKVPVIRSLRAIALSV